MPPVDPRELTAITAHTLVTDVLMPAAITAALDLSVQACVTTQRGQRPAAGDFQPVQPGWRWGPVWSTAWFTCSGTMPEGEGAPAVRFSSGTEALLIRDGEAWHGLDANHDLVRLPEDASGDMSFEVEAACNRPLGATLFWWDPPEDHARWAEDTPGRFEHAQLVRVHEPTWELAVGIDFGVRLLRALEGTAPQAQQVADALVHVGTMIDDDAVHESAPAALHWLRSALAGSHADTQVTAVGHAHIDTAWLWPIAETRRKIRRSWATALRLMDRYENFCFTASQAQQYAWLEEDDPALFNAIAARVQEGRWEAGGTMWVEPDCQVPSGESLIRQFIHGTAWWQDRFGAAGSQSVLFLPDTFGFPASLPQLVKLAGLERFITNKICWNEVTAFPFVDFTWQGIDGTRIASHFTPGHTYNAELEPKDLVGAQANAMADRHGRSTAWMQPYGWGDGGGGPTDTMVERARWSGSAPGLPQVTMGTLGGFTRPESVTPPAIWDGELYLEMHRGTFTSHGWLKRANLQAEESLRLAELLSVGDAVGRIETRRALVEAWRRLLLQQFHDILPGSSIGAVYEDCRRDMATVQMEAASRIDAHVTGDTHAFNPASTTRSGVLADDAGRCRWFSDAPPLGCVALTDTLPADVQPVEVDGLTLSNAIVSCRIGDDGCVHDLKAQGATRALAGPLNTLHLYRDRPRRWEAWDIDREYRDHEIDLAPAASVECVSSDPMCAIIEVKRDIADASAVVMRYILRAGSPVLEVECSIDWAQSRRLLRCEFGTDIRASQATYGIQMGHIRRPTHENTAFDAARFEVPGHRWMDLAESGCGLAVLDRGIYGRSGLHGRLGLSLLRAPEFPDPDADRGAHVLRWGLMPHAGCALQAGVVAEAEVFAGREAMATQPQAAPFSMDVSAPAQVEIMACKGAEDDRGMIVRLVEVHGAHGTATMHWPAACVVSSCDLHEQPLGLDGLHHDGDTTIVPLRPFGVVTLRIEPTA
ncbi:MAG: glycosyl hydrolase-related protein [Phycisphaerales bacterium]|nr:glycosyl hydrolase-related protein [Phycisphaerales bacterium]